MENTARDHTAQPNVSRHHKSPEGMVIGAFEPSTVAAVKAALVAAGIPADQIDVMTPEDIDELEAPLTRPGIKGLVGRLLLSLGDELDELERARQELSVGHVLIGVPVMGDDRVHQVRDIMREHGGHAIIRFGRWTITAFD